MYYTQFHLNEALYCIKPHFFVPKKHPLLTYIYFHSGSIYMIYNSLSLLMSLSFFWRQEMKEMTLWKIFSSQWYRDKSAKCWLKYTYAANNSFLKFDDWRFDCWQILYILWISWIISMFTFTLCLKWRSTP